MAGQSFSVTLEGDLGGLLDGVRQGIMPHLVQSTLKASEYAAGNVRREIRAWVSETETRKTGRLMRSFLPRIVRASGTQVVGGVFSGLVYARIHEFGGKIVPRRGRALAIPMTAQARRRTARDFQGLIRIGRVLFSMKMGKARGKKGFGRGQFIAQYALVRSVRIRPKGYLVKALLKSQDGIREILTFGQQQNADAQVRKKGA